MSSGYTFYGNVIGINRQGSGPAIRPDTQPREQAEPLMAQGPYVVVADRVLEEHDWCLHHPNIQGIVAEFGGATSHGAVVAREENIACVVNAKGATKVMPGEMVSVDGQTGQVDIDGGGGAALPEGEGDPIKNFVWNNQSWMISDAGGQGHDEMVRYMTDFGLWNSYGSMGSIYDNGYAQVDQMPPDQELFTRFLKTQYPHLQNVGTEPPTRGRFQPPAGHPALQQGQAPGQMAQTDLYRFVWLNGVNEWRPVDPHDPNKEGTTHQSMIEDMQMNGTWDWEQAMMGEAVAGIIYDSGKVEVYTGGTQPSDVAAMEQWVRTQFPIAKEFEYVAGGMLNVMGSTKEADGAWRDMKDALKVRNQQGDYSTWSDEDRARTRALVHSDQGMSNHLAEVELVINAVRSGDQNEALRAANILSGNGYEKNPWAGMNAQDIVDTIAQSQHQAKTAMYDYQKIYAAIAGTAYAMTYGPDFIRLIISRLKNGEPPASVVEDLPPEVQERILDALASPVTNMTPYDQYTSALKCPNCDSHTIRGENLDKEDSSKYHCLSCKHEWKAEAVKEKNDMHVGASTLSKGQRVQLTHPEYKGVRGTITDDGKRHEDLNEDQYDILLDNGEEISDIPESAFKKIKSAAAQDPHFFFVEELEDDDLIQVEARAKPLPEDVLTGIDEPWLGNGYEGHPVMCYMCGNQRSASLGTRCESCGYVLSIRRDGPVKNAAPNWRMSTVIATDGTPTTMAIGSEVEGNQQVTHMYESGGQQTVCGKPVTSLQQTSNNPGLQNVPCPTCFGNRMARVKLADSNGEDLAVGEWYMMHSEKYPVPDVIMVKEIGEDKTITANIEGDDKGLFPITITADDWHTNKYRFERYTPHTETHEVKLARKNYSQTQQNEFVNENLTGRARNIHKVTLEDTHYAPDAMEEGKTSYFTISENDPLGAHFLW